MKKIMSLTIIIYCMLGILVLPLVHARDKVDKEEVEDYLRVLEVDLSDFKTSLENSKKSVDEEIENFQDGIRINEEILNSPDLQEKAKYAALAHVAETPEDYIESLHKSIERNNELIGILQMYRNTGLSVSTEPGKSLFIEYETALLSLKSVYYNLFCIERITLLIDTCNEKITTGISMEEYETIINEAEIRNNSLFIDGVQNTYGWLPLDLEKDLYGMLVVENVSSNINGNNVSGNESDSTDFSDNVKKSLIGGLLAGLGVLGASGLSGALGGTTNNKGTNNDKDTSQDENSLEDTENDIEEDAEEDNKGQLVLECDIEDESLEVGDSEKSITLFARIKANPEDNIELKNAAELAMTNIDIKPQGKAAKYVYIEKQIDSNEWIRFNISFTYKMDSKFYKGDEGLTFPMKIPVLVNAGQGVSPNSKTLYLQINKPKARILLDPKTIVMPDNSNEHPKIEARIRTMDKNGWSFKTEVVDSLENAIKEVNIINQKENNSECSIAVNSKKIEEGAGSSITNSIKVMALNTITGEEVERILNVTVAREGFLVVSQRPVKLYADGYSETELELTAIKAQNGQISTDYELLRSVEFESVIHSDNKIAQNAFEMAGLEFSEGKLNKVVGLTEENVNSYIYKMKSKREVPGAGENYYGSLNIKATNGIKNYMVNVPILLDVSTMGPGSKIWQKELENCYKIIKKIPKTHQQRMLDLVNNKKELLGARGLYKLRWRIWKTGQALWEAEGLSGYEDVERWAGYIENTLNIAQWMGKMATDVLISQYTGTFTAIAVGELYDVVVSSINAYEDGLSFEEWFDKYFKNDIMEIIENLGAEALDPERVVKKIGKSPKKVAIAILALFGYYFIFNMSVKKMDIIDAATSAAKQVAFAGAVKFFSKKVSKYLGKRKGSKTDVEIENSKKSPDIELGDDAAHKLGFEKARKKINALKDAIEKGDDKAIKKYSIEIKKDKYAIAEINGNLDRKMKYPDDLKNTVNKVFNNEIKAPTEKILKNKVTEHFEKKGFKDVEIIFDGRSNPVKKVKVGSDWDVGYKVKYKTKSGKTIIRKISEKDLKPMLNDSLYEAAGNKFGKGLNPNEFAEDLDVAAMGPDSAGGYGKDLDKALELKDNVQKYIKDNKSIKLEDPQALGMSTEHKVLEWLNKADDMAKTSGNRSMIQGTKMEGIKQISKQYKNILKPMKQISKGRNLTNNDLPSILKDAVGLIDKVAAGEKSPEYLEKVLKNKGYSLRDIASMLGEQVEGYGKILS
ncbi:MAG: hypothetical protein ACOWWH_13040 [Eubacteriaceae bacterium]